jgi:hypothetical protein
MSTKTVCKNAAKTFSLLNELSKKIGAFGVCNWSDEEKLTFQCDKDILISWLNKNNLSINSMFTGSKAYECKEFVAFYYEEGENK